MFETMLIVDDFELEREMFTELLQGSFTILEAENGQECIETIESCKGHIDVVLLDLMMPVMDGFEVLEKRKQMEYFKEVPVIVLTSSGAVDDQIRAFQLGANDFISKPIIPDIAVSRINNVLISRRRIMSILKESEEFKIKSEIDQMTDLYNKVTSETLIEQVLQIQHEQLHAMMVLDIDNFKTINDQEGHQVGDHTIRIIADLIATHFQRENIVGRIGGDEFIVLMTDLPNKEIARQKAKDIVRIMKYKPNLTLPANVSVSVGLVFNERKITTYKELFAKADEALYQSKNLGKARLTEYGEKQVELRSDGRNAVILCSRIRNTCSIIESVFHKDMRLVDVGDVSEMRNVIAQVKGKIAIIYVDVSDYTSDADGVWKNIRQLSGIEKVPIVAICAEGRIDQYKCAVLSDIVSDVMTAPLDVEQLRRRNEALIQAD